jgi:hypothetical protein
MSPPPNPGIPALFLAVAARLGFVLKVRDPALGELGVLADGSIEHPLFLASAGADRIVWTLDSGPHLDPHFLSRATYDVLAGGSLRDDGSLSYEGKSYWLRFRWSASGMVAEAMTAEHPAA